MSTSVVTLVTGLQGNGKTLYTIQAVKEQSEKEGRQVYYHGISELQLPWIPLDTPEEWFKVPDGAIIVLDEAQKAFRVRAPSAKVPPHVEALETLRHRGLTLYLITQHPMIIDGNARRLCGRHLHLVRAFGMQGAVVHEFASVRENCDKPHGRKDSIKKDWRFPKEVFSLYKSAEIHTVKRKIPRKVFLVIPLLLASLGGWGYLGYKVAYKPLSENGEKKETVTAAPVQAGQPVGPGASSSNSQVKPLSPTEYVERYAPRVAGLDYTAPVYDELTKPTRVPVPAACVSMRGVCRCYSQQGTRLQVNKEQCQQIVQNGFFLAFDPDPRPMAQPAPVQQVSMSTSGQLGQRPLDTVDLQGFPEHGQR